MQADYAFYVCFMPVELRIKVSKALTREAIHSFEFNLVHLFGESQAAKAFMEMGPQWVAANDGERLGISTQAIL
jgi:hypothetical protein